MCAIAFDLLIGGYSAKDDLSELAAFKGAVSDASKKNRQKKKICQPNLCQLSLTMMVSGVGLGNVSRTLVPPEGA